MASSQGSQSQAAFDLVGVDTNSTFIDLVSETLTAEHSLVESEGIRGTRSRTKERVRRGLVTVSGDTVHHPSPTELDALLPVILGGTETTDTFPLAETLPEYDIMVDKVARVFDFEDLKCDRAVFSSSPGQPLELTMSHIGKTIAETNAGTFPALTPDTDTMYVFTDAVFTYNSTTYEINDMELTIDNLVEARYGSGSVTATSIDATDRRVTLTVTAPWTSSETALYDISSVAGADGSLVLTNGNQSLSFAFANMKLAPATTPVVGGRGEITQGLTFNIYKSGTTNELIVTHDSTA